MSNISFEFENSEAPEVLPFLQKEINIAARDGDVRALKRLLEDGADVNDKDIYGRTPLHYGVNNGHLVIVNILLKHGADVTRATKKGSTPLHTASYKGNKDIVEVLLQHTPRDMLNAFVNAKTMGNENTPLHIAAEFGYLEPVKTFLKHSAVFNSENKEGKTPNDLSNSEEVTNFFKLIEETFRAVISGNVESIRKVRDLKHDALFAITNACNSQGNTLLQLAMANKQMVIVDELLKIQRVSKLNHLKRLEYAADLYVIFSELYLPMLERMFESSGTQNNALEQGSYYLQNAHQLVQVYREGTNGPIEDESIQSVYDTLVALEFDPKHTKSEYSGESCGGSRESIVFKGQGTKYYKLLCSKSTEDRKMFLEMVVQMIDIPVKRCLMVTKRRLKCDQLFEAIQNEKLSEVQKSLRNIIDINLKDSNGRTPLHHAVNIGNVNIVGLLLQKGADPTEITNYKGNTALHIASSKGFKAIVESLLKHIGREKLNEFLNAKTASGGNTPLHIASKGGHLQVVKALLSHGAIYDSENKDGKLPVDLSENQEVANLLNLIEELFRDVRKDDIVAIQKLRGLQSDELSAIANAHNSVGKTLLEMAIDYQHADIGRILMKILTDT